jgi:hypothetical protein
LNHIEKQLDSKDQNLEDILLWDPFDPIYLRDAFDTKAINLGHLIFGNKKWEELNGPLSTIPDPLSGLFARRGMFLLCFIFSVNNFQGFFPHQLVLIWDVILHSIPKEVDNSEPPMRIVLRSRSGQLFGHSL